MIPNKKRFFIQIAILVDLLCFSQSLKASTPPNIDDWLSAHPAVANAIVWEFPAPLPPPAPPPSGGARLLGFLNTLLGGSSRSLQLSRANTRSNSVTHQTLTMKDPVDETLCQRLGYCQVLREQTEQVPQPPSQDPVLGAQALNWPNMASLPEGQALQTKIRNDFANLWNWIELGWPKYQEYLNTGVKPADFDTIFNITEPANYPPPNLQYVENPPAKNSIYTVIPNDAGMDLYSKMVALSLVLEIKGVLGFTVTDLSSEHLSVIFDGTQWFHFVPAGPSAWGDIVKAGYLVVPVVLPAPADFMFSFMVQNKMVGGSRLDMVVKWLDWQRYHLTHMFWGKTHADCTVKPEGFYSDGYLGDMPFTRLLNGTKMACPIYYDDGQGGEFPVFFPETRNYTGGCGMTSLVNEIGLRTINIVAKATSYGHKQNYFKVDNNAPLWMTHADHSHALLDFPEIPTGDILMDDAAKKLLFVDYDPADPNLTQAQKDAYAAQNNKGIGRRLADLMVKYLPKKMLHRYCFELGVPHSDGVIYSDYFKNTYSVGELENYNLNGQTVNLWTLMDNKIANLYGSCAQAVW